MRAQILLIALLVWGPVGSAICEATCQQSSAAAQVAAAELPAAPVSGASHCHGGGSPVPASAPHGSDSSDSACACVDYDRATAITLFAPGQGTVAFAPAALLEIRGVQIARSATLRIDPPGQAISPYLVQNPPLLI
jgi:hypothetical protein